jgi:small subunit ribosomal protein S6
MRRYETIYIVNPNVSDEEYHEINKKYSNLIESRNGIVVKTQEWGKQRMAYPVKKFYNGFYFLLDFCADSGVTAELVRNFKIDERILKHQTIKLADKADPKELILEEKDNSKEIKDAGGADKGLETQDQGSVTTNSMETMEESEGENGGG